MKRNIFILMLLFLCSNVYAIWNTPQELKNKIEEKYPPAVKHRALDTAYEQLDLSKVQCFVVLKQGGVPAERAQHYITWSDYDYRPVRIDGDYLKTRKGTIYAHLKEGDVLTVARVEYAKEYIYLALITPHIYKLNETTSSKKFSRVTTLLGFKFPKQVIKGADTKTIFAKMDEWLAPFNSLEDAERYAANLKGDSSYTPPSEVTSAPQKEVVQEDESDLAILPADSKVHGTWKVEKKDSAPITLHVGMRSEEVLKLLGEPQQKAVLSGKVVYRYPDKVVEFREGKVYDVIFITR